MSGRARSAKPARHPKTPSATLSKHGMPSGPCLILLSPFHRLSVGDRLELIEQIWNSLPESISPQDVPEWHQAELARRRAVAESEPGLGKAWRDVLGPFEADR